METVQGDPTSDQNKEPVIDSNSDSGNNTQLDPERVEKLEEAAKGEALKSLFNSLGVKGADELKGIITAKNESDKANHTELENAQNDLAKQKKNSDRQAKQIADLQAQNAVLQAGVVSDHVEDVTILAQSRISKGTAKTFDEAVNAVLESNPQFKGKQQLGSDGTAIDGNTSNNNANAIKITSDMSLEQLQDAYEKNPNALNQFLESK